MRRVCCVSQRVDEDYTVHNKIHIIDTLDCVSLFDVDHALRDRHYVCANVYRSKSLWKLGY